jgi:hypothetical protein
MVMSAPFYIANLAATTNVTASTSSNSAVILPANAVVMDVSITETGTGNIDLGFTPLSGVGPGQTTTLGTKVLQGFLANASTATRVNVAVGGTGGGASLGNVANATNLVVVVSTANASAAGNASGVITYFVSTNESEDV